jgi:hypothetical protein
MDSVGRPIANAWTAGRDFNPPRRLSLLIPLVVFVTVAGCATHVNRVASVQEAFYAGNLQQAAETTSRLLEEPKYDADVLKLDQAMIALASGEPRQAESLLKEVRNQFDHLEQADIREEVLSMINDERRRAYSGENYEKILIRTFLSLSNLMSDGGDAAAYALQAADKQQQIEAGLSQDDLPASTHRIALAPYMRAAILEETHNNYDDLQRSRIQVVNWESQFRDGAIDLDRAKSGRHSRPDYGVVYVFTLLGRGPIKQEVSEQPTSAALLIADRILSHTMNQTLPPTVAAVKVPQVVAVGGGPETVRVDVDGFNVGTTATLTNIGQLAVAQHRATYPKIVARAVVRRVLKKGTVYTAKEQTGISAGSPADMVFNLAGIAWEATERADTRSWRLLPDRIQVLRAEVPVGTHQIVLTPTSGGKAVGFDSMVTFEIHDGRNTYVMATFPNNQLVGQVLTSNH